VRVRVLVRRTSRSLPRSRFLSFTFYPPPPPIPFFLTPRLHTRARTFVRCVYEPLFRTCERVYARERSPSETPRRGGSATAGKGALTKRRRASERASEGARERESERHRDRGAALVLIGPGHAIFTIRRHGHLVTGRRSYLAAYVQIEL